LNEYVYNVINAVTCSRPNKEEKCNKNNPNRVVLTLIEKCLNVRIETRNPAVINYSL